MKPDIHACKNTCRIRDICHPELRPETINIAGGTGVITDKHLHVAGTFCRHYTCWSGGGENAAKKAKSGSAESFMVIERNGRGHTIRGWAFGTFEKPTEKEKLRIVSTRGYIYSFQDGAYFATGQSINEG